MVELVVAPGDEPDHHDAELAKAPLEYGVVAQRARHRHHGIEDFWRVGEREPDVPTAALAQHALVDRPLGLRQSSNFEYGTRAIVFPPRIWLPALLARLSGTLRAASGIGQADRAARAHWPTTGVTNARVGPRRRAPRPRVRNLDESKRAPVRCRQPLSRWTARREAGNNDATRQIVRRSRRGTREDECRDANPLLRIEDVSVRFGGVRALDGVSCRGARRRDLRPDRPERRRQDHAVQLRHAALYGSRAAPITFDGARIDQRAGARDRRARHRAHVPESRHLSGHDGAGERAARRAPLARRPLLPHRAAALRGGRPRNGG